VGRLSEYSSTYRGKEIRFYPDTMTFFVVGDERLEYATAWACVCHIDELLSP
jgi:hypothetical protein